MKKFGTAVALVLLGSVGEMASASVLFGPEGEFSSLFGRLEYDPSRACTKPIRPFSNDEYARDQYVTDAKRYISCMSDAAESDTKYASNVVSDGLEKATDEFVAEVRRGY